MDPGRTHAVLGTCCRETPAKELVSPILRQFESSGFSQLWCSTWLACLNPQKQKRGLGHVYPGNFSECPKFALYLPAERKLSSSNVEVNNVYSQQVSSLPFSL